MRAILLIFMLFSTRSLFGQDSSLDGKKSTKTCKVFFTTFNHAELLYKGTTTYILTPSYIKVKKTFFGEKKARLVYTKKSTPTDELCRTLSQIGLDSLEDSYINYCVMLTSGDEYFLDVTKVATKKNISLHHYYLKQLDEIIQIINSKLPLRYRFNYLTKDTKQDCNLPILKKG